VTSLVVYGIAKLRLVAVCPAPSPHVTPGVGVAVGDLFADPGREAAFLILGDSSTLSRDEQEAVETGHENFLKDAGSLEFIKGAL